MAFEFRLPDMRGSEAEQLRQLRGYFYSLIPELQWALNSLAGEKENTLNTVQQQTDSVAADEWRSLGLSDAVSDPSEVLGEMGAGCFCRKDGGRVRVVFSCGASAQTPVTVSAEPLAVGFRPRFPVYALCAATLMTADGAEYGIVYVRVSPDGSIEILWAHPLTEGAEVAAIGAVDGRVEYALE